MSVAAPITTSSMVVVAESSGELARTVRVSPRSLAPSPIMCASCPAPTTPTRVSARDVSFVMTETLLARKRGSGLNCALHRDFGVLELIQGTLITHESDQGLNHGDRRLRVIGRRIHVAHEGRVAVHDERRHAEGLVALELSETLADDLVGTTRGDVFEDGARSRSTPSSAVAISDSVTSRMARS